MHRTVTQVANGRFLNKEQFQKFCDEHGTRLGMYRDASGELMVSTWFVDDLVKAAKEASVQRLTFDEIRKLCS